MTQGKAKYRNILTVAFIAILLFNYANTGLFWHSHMIGGASVVHSHIYGKAHGTGNSSGGHTSGQLQIIDVICHAVFTADAVPEIRLERQDVLDYVIILPAVRETAQSHSESFSLRGPPALV